MDGNESRMALNWRHQLIAVVLASEVALVAAWTAFYAVHVDTRGRRARSIVFDCMRDLAGSDLLLSDRPEPLPRRCEDIPFYALHPVWYSAVLSAAMILMTSAVLIGFNRRDARSR